MDEGLISWWMVILLGIGTAGLCIGISAYGSFTYRAGGLALGLVYLVLLAYVLGTDSRLGAAQAKLTDLPQVVLGVVSLAAAGLAVAGSTDRGRTCALAGMSFSNAGLAGLNGATGLALALGAIGFTALADVTVRTVRHRSVSFAELLPAIEPRGARRLGYAALAFLTGLLLSLSVLAIVRYAQTAESTRPTTTRRLSKFPQRSRIREVLQISRDAEPPQAPLRDRRPDLMILLGALAFVSGAVRWPRSRVDFETPHDTRAASGSGPQKESGTA